MSAMSNGHIMWVFYNDFYKEDEVITNDRCLDYYEAVTVLKDHKLKVELDKFKAWQDDPAFNEGFNEGGEDE